MAGNGKDPKREASKLSFATQMNIAKEIDYAEAQLKVGQLHEEWKAMRNKVVALQKKLARKCFHDEINKLLNTAREPEKRVIEKLRKAKEFAIWHETINCDGYQV